MASTPSLPIASLLVACGGAFGSWLRFVTARLWTMAIGPVATAAFPWSTLTVNVLGSLVMGLLMGWLARHAHGAETWRLLLGIGVIGGFTTFSSFALDFGVLAERGALGLGFIYIAVTLLAGIGALFAGLAVMRAIA